MIFFKKSEKLRIIFFRRKKEKKFSILFVFPIDQISLQPELSSPPRFRIQVPQALWTNGGRTEILVSNVGYFTCHSQPLVMIRSINQ